MLSVWASIWGSKELETMAAALALVIGKVFELINAGGGGATEDVVDWLCWRPFGGGGWVRDRAGDSWLLGDSL